MSTCKPISTPVDSKSKLTANAGSLISDASSYRSLVDALQYRTFTRPDISYAVQQVCLFMHDPREARWQALKCILRYLQGTIDYGIHFQPSTLTQLVAYFDANWVGCLTPLFNLWLLYIFGGQSYFLELKASNHIFSFQCISSSCQCHG